MKTEPQPPYFVLHPTLQPMKFVERSTEPYAIVVMTPEQLEAIKASPDWIQTEKP